MTDQELDTIDPYLAALRRQQAQWNGAWASEIGREHPYVRPESLSPYSLSVVVDGLNDLRSQDGPLTSYSFSKNSTRELRRAIWRYKDKEDELEGLIVDLIRASDAYAAAHPGFSRYEEVATVEQLRLLSELNHEQAVLLMTIMDPFGPSPVGAGGEWRPNSSDLGIGGDPFESQNPKPGDTGGGGPSGGGGGKGPHAQRPDPPIHQGAYGSGPSALPNTPAFGGLPGGNLGMGGQAGVGPGSFDQGLGPGSFGQFGPGGFGQGFGPGGFGRGPGGGPGSGPGGGPFGGGSSPGFGGSGHTGGGAYSGGGGYSDPQGWQQFGGGGAGHFGGDGGPSGGRGQGPTGGGSHPDPGAAGQSKPDVISGSDSATQSDGADVISGGSTYQGIGGQGSVDPADNNYSGLFPGSSGDGQSKSSGTSAPKDSKPKDPPPDPPPDDKDNSNDQNRVGSLPVSDPSPDPGLDTGGDAGEGPPITPGFHFTPHGGNTGRPIEQPPDPVDSSWSGFQQSSNPIAAMLALGGGGGDDWGGNNPHYDPAELADPETTGRYRGNEGYKPDPDATGPNNPHSYSGKASQASRYVIATRASRLAASARSLRYK